MNDDLGVQWALANPLTIQMDTDGNAWNAGAARDVVALDEDRVLVATDTGGIWMVHRDGASLAVADVEYPDFWCIVAGTYGNDHFYAAGTKLYETDISKSGALLNWREIPVTWTELDVFNKPFTNHADAIYRILILKEDKRIVLATTDGVVWADIPPAPPRPKGCLSPSSGGSTTTPPVYNWQAAKGLDYARKGYLGLTAGPPHRGEIERNICVASWGYAKDKIQEPLQFYFGEWQGADLVMKKSTMNSIAEVDNSMARATTLASCTAHAERMYAISSDDAGFPLMVWRSETAGLRWDPIVPELVTPNDKTFAEAAGNQGNSSGRPCNCITVSRTNPDLVVVGWRVGGFFVSDDGGFKWRRTDTESSLHTHSDVHAVYFDPTDASGQRVFMAHDGGISMSPDLGANPALFESFYNRQLATLQFQSSPSRMFFGSTRANPAQNGVMIGGTQDNGVLTSSIQPTIEGWSQFDGGDGFQTTFLRHGQALYNNNDETLTPFIGIVRHAFWSTSPKVLVLAQYIPVLRDDPQMPSPAGLPAAPGATVVFSAVPASGWTNREGEPMFAVAAKRSSIYGLFYSDLGTRAHWEFLARFSLNEILDEADIKAKNWEPWSISAIASLDGNVIFMGTNGGRLIMFDQRNRFAQEITVPLRNNPYGDKGSEVSAISVAHDRLAFATYNIGRSGVTGGSYSRYKKGYVLRIRPPHSDQLTALPVEAYYGVEVAREPEQNALYVSTDNKVYVSRDRGDDLGDTWLNASRGLPKRSHCGDISFVKQPNGERWLYLSSYGRSFWRARR